MSSTAFIQLVNSELGSKPTLVLAGLRALHYKLLHLRSSQQNFGLSHTSQRCRRERLVLQILSAHLCHIWCWVPDAEWWSRKITTPSLSQLRKREEEGIRESKGNRSGKETREHKVKSEIDAARMGEAGSGRSRPCAGGRPWWGRARGGQRPAPGSHPGASAHSSYFSVW